MDYKQKGLNDKNFFLRISIKWQYTVIITSGHCLINKIFTLSPPYIL